jgi:hypothetical protein
MFAAEIMASYDIILRKETIALQMYIVDNSYHNWIYQ